MTTKYMKSRTSLGKPIINPKKNSNGAEPILTEDRYNQVKRKSEEYQKNLDKLEKTIEEFNITTVTFEKIELKKYQFRELLRQKLGKLNIHIPYHDSRRMLTSKIIFSDPNTYKPKVIGEVNRDFDNFMITPYKLKGDELKAMKDLLKIVNEVKDKDEDILKDKFRRENLEYIARTTYFNTPHLN